ncbi:hypothetical protein RNN91_01015 [Mycoplasmopsis felis]|uniref:Uncharacterized protein n=1 Tax=Mycoplasmopsis felis TaxID=33923 RepID=A0A809S118_9BACT|nr:hypothetical protein [Mycoplasmopsis felis]WQQ01420.1 hypothetical protein RRG54_02415 [Mycoplasmopsis felis]BBU47807.1 hypothetical protein JPM2_5000 [Mycoplasmopsis felis]
MNKKNKWIKNLSLLGVLSSPIIALSMEPGTTNTQPNTNKPPAPPVLSNDFPKFKDQAQEATATNLAQALKTAISYLENELNKVVSEKDQVNEKDENGEPAPYDYKKKISRLTYLNQLISFVKENEADINKNPLKYGINAIFPRVISEETKLNYGEVTFNGENFQNVKLGLKDPTDYVKAVEGNGNIRKTSSQPEVNAITPNKLKEALAKYGEKLRSDLGSVFYNPEDLTLIEEDFNVTFEKINDKYVYTISNPKDFSSWNEYFISKIKPRYTAFDLSANQEIEIQEESEEQPNPDDPEKPPKPPLTNPDETKPTEPVDPEEQILSLPILSPIPTYNYLNKNITDLKNVFDSSNNEGKEKIFFFDNPINTRYVYSVQSLEVKNNQLIAVVKIQDSNQDDLHRSYSVVVKEYAGTDKSIKFQYLYEVQVKNLKNHFIKLYKAVGLDEKINYKDLRYQELINPLFAMVAKGVDFSNEEKTYIETQKNILNIYADSQDIVRLSEGNSNVESSINTFLAYVTSNLKSSRINNYGYYANLANGYESMLDRVKESIENTDSKIKATLEKNLESLNFKTSIVNSFYNKLEIDVFKLKQLAQPSQATFNVLNWYENYISQLTTVSNNMKTLYELFNSKDLTEEINKTKDSTTSETPKSQTEPNSDENTETKQLSELDIFKNAYAKMEKEVTDEVNTNNNTLKTFGYVLLALGSIGTIINALAALINLKNKSRKVKGLYLIMGIALAMVIIIAAVFLGVGMKGI